MVLKLLLFWKACWPYMSPEQTGRTNWTIDSRIDLYSLEATLYDILTGHPPFQADDALEMVYCHLAQIPVPPCEIIDNLQLSLLSDIVMKLLAKNAGDRYHSAYGVKVDLERCRPDVSLAKEPQTRTFAVHI